MTIKKFIAGSSLVLVSLFGGAQTVQAFQASMGVVTDVKANTSQIDIPQINFRCSTAQEVKVGDSVVVGLSQNGTGLVFDERALGNITVPSNGFLYGNPRIENGGKELRFTAKSDCALNQSISITGIRASVVNTSSEGTARVYVNINDGSSQYSDFFKVDTQAPRITSARLIKSNGVTTQLGVTFNEPVYAGTTAAHQDLLVYATMTNNTTVRTVVLSGVASQVGTGFIATELLFNIDQTSLSGLGGAEWQILARSGGVIKDAVGNSVDAQYNVKFVDVSTNPTVSSSVNNNSVVSINAPVVFTFSRAMDTGSVSVNYSPSVSYNTSWSQGSTVLTVSPQNQSYGQSYTLSVSGRAQTGEYLQGNNGSQYTVSYSIQSSPSSNDPQVTLLIAGGSLDTYTADVLVNVSSSYGDQIQFAQNSEMLNATGYESITGTKSISLLPNNGFATVCARVRNTQSGKVSPVSCDNINVLLGMSGAPYNPYITINSGNGSTNNQTVTLQLGAINASHMAISNYSDFKDAYWESYSNSKQWSLLAGNSTKRVYVQFKNNDGKLSQVVSATITLDGSVQFGTPSGNIVINGGSQTASTIYVTLDLSATNADQIQIGSQSDLADAGAYQQYYATRTYTLLPKLGLQYVCVRYRNSSNGATSSTMCDSIDLVSNGVNKPFVSYVRINDGQSTAIHRNVQLYFGVTGANRVAVSNTSDFSNATWDWFENIKYWQLSPGNGLKTVYYMFASDNGSVTDVSTTTITLQDTMGNNDVVQPQGPTDIRTLPSGVYAHMLVKRAGNSAVYYIGRNGYRYTFPNQKVFLSWYTALDLKATNKGGLVVTIADSTLASIPLGGNVTYRPGTKMVKFIDNPKVYVVDSNGLLRWVASEQVARDLYGSAWATQVEDIADSFFVNYKTGSDITSSSMFNPASAKTNAPNVSHDKSLPGNN